ncbi:MAG TPA: hypothetical protein PKY59_22530 [Pyrinomonadaceae bacterium]|nr:hypothetical protein [Pyrinomonadaceae bacterium]
MKIRANVEMLGIPATIVSANLPQGTSVKITADETVDKATANTLTIGEVRKCHELANKKGTIETPFRAIADCKVSGGTALVAGDFCKTGAPDGTTGEDTVAKFVVGTDAETLKRGVVWKGAANGGTATILLY